MKSFNEFEKKHPRDKRGRFAKKRRFVKNEEFDYIWKDRWWRRMMEGSFPRLSPSNSNILGEATGVYNCIAYALGITDRWWFPGSASIGYWPKKLRARGEEASFQKLFKFLEAEETTDLKYEKGFVKIAVYRDKNGSITHFSKLNPNGNWSSKLGGNVLIEHDFQSLSGGSYGFPTRVFKIKNEKHALLKEM